MGGAFLAMATATATTATTDDASSAVAVAGAAGAWIVVDDTKLASVAAAECCALDLLAASLDVLGTATRRGKQPEATIQGKSGDGSSGRSDELLLVDPRTFDPMSANRSSREDSIDWAALAVEGLILESSHDDAKGDSRDCVDRDEDDDDDEDGDDFSRCGVNGSEVGYFKALPAVMPLLEFFVEDKNIASTIETTLPQYDGNNEEERDARANSADEAADETTKLAAPSPSSPPAVSLSSPASSSSFLSLSSSSAVVASRRAATCGASRRGVG